MTKTLKLSGKMKTIQLAGHHLMLPDMIEKCNEHFVPQVQKLTGGRRAVEHFTIEFMEEMKQVNGLRFEMQIDIEGMLAYDLKQMLQRLDALCSWEPRTPVECGFTLNGYTFTVGDGDDTNAVYIRNGKVCVWVRAWKE